MNIRTVRLPHEFHATCNTRSPSPGRPIEFKFENWQPALVKAAGPFGWKKCFGFHRLGRKLT